MAASTTRARRQRPRSALVFVEDDGLASTIEHVLIEEGWEVFDVSNIDDARRALEAMAPGVVVIDIGLAVEDLERFLVEIEGRERPPPVVVLSDLAMAKTIAREHQLIFVHEPFDLDELVTAIECARRLEATPRRIAR